MKSGSWVVIRYSSTHEKTLPNGSLRCRMELHRTPPTSPQGPRTAQDPRPSRDHKRHLLPAEERMSVAPAPARLPQVAHRLPLLQSLAHRWHLGEDQPSHPRAPQGTPEARSPTQRGRGGFSVGQEHRRGRRRARLRWGQEGEGPQTPQLLVDTEGFVLSRSWSTAPRCWTARASRRY